MARATRDLALLVRPPRPPARLTEPEGEAGQGAVRPARSRSNATTAARQAFRIVGEDEADPAQRQQHLLSDRALGPGRMMGAAAGDVVNTGQGEADVLAVS